MRGGLDPLGQVLRALILIALAVALLGVAVLFRGKAGHVPDEALAAHRPAASFPAADEDYFSAMDGGAKNPMSPLEAQGRNTWMVWTGGNDRFWDTASNSTFGNFDLLKTISSYPAMAYGRDNRWAYLGVINEPCFQKATAPDPQHFGLWLDQRSPGCSPDPFENGWKYPGVVVGARGRTTPAGSYYGQATGILGLRLFPNPDFDEAALKKWDPVRFYTDPSYYNSQTLVRPYRVGMSCAFCHVAPSPTAPPADPNNPKWENLSATVGAQYFWVDRIFSWRADPRSYLYQLFHTSRPGTLDTSLVSTDYINNPRTMNAVYNLEDRLKLAHALGRETMGEANLQNRQLPGDFQKPDTVWTPRVLKDGSDSVGALAALNRVYLNIGLFSEEWLLHFNAFTGGKPVTPISIAAARHNSSYWNATEAQTVGMAAFLEKAGFPHRLSDAPGGGAYLAAAPATVAQGRAVFADRCGRCHSSKLPALPVGTRPFDCSGADYLACWNRYWALSKTPPFKAQMREIVDAPDFLKDNFLSTEMRVPVSLLRTNLCSPLATNALAGMVWDQFSSKTYKALPSVGQVSVMNPITGQTKPYDMPAGGRGFIRPASLISVWASAPYLLNNSVGHFDESPSVQSRMQAFDDGIRQMLWPERRVKDARFPSAPGVVDRLQQPVYLTIPKGYLPGFVQPLLGPLSALVPALFVNAVHPLEVVGATTQGSAVINGVAAPDPIASFTYGRPISGAGLPAGARVVRYDAAGQALQISAPATATATGARLHASTPEQGIRIGPMPPGMPINLVLAVELAPEHSDLISRVRHDAALVKLLLGAKHDAAQISRTPDPAARQPLYDRLDGRLYAMSKCPDYVVNRGHYFGTDQLGEEPGLSDPDKEALISFLKTF